MTHLLIQATSYGRPIDWSNFCRQAGNLSLPIGVERLAENVWLAEQAHGTAFVALLRQVAKRNAISFRSLEFAPTSAWSQHP
jgi:hypothetical protein